MIVHTIEYICDAKGCKATTSETEGHTPGSEFRRPYPPSGWLTVDSVSKIYCPACSEAVWKALDGVKVVAAK